MSTSEHQDEHDETLGDEIEELGEEDHSRDLEPEDDPEGESEPEAPAAQGAPADDPEVEEFIYEEVGVDSDHRVAQLRKLKHQFGDEMVLTNQTLTMEDTGPAMIVCPNPNCNSEEIRGQKFCSKCNARLPQLPLVEQKYNPGSIDGAARKYFDAINDFHAGESTLEEFMEFLHDGLDKVRAHVENLADLSSDGVMAEWLPQASNLLSEATQLWHDSVEAMLERCDHAFVEYEEEEAEYEELSEELSEEELAEREPPMLPEDRIRSLDFTNELNAIFRANDQMLEYLRIVDTSLKSEATVGGMQF